MTFSKRIATLAAVVAIPLCIAATSYALTDSPEPAKAPPKVELDSGSPSATPSITPASPTTKPGDEVVTRSPVTDGPSGDDDGAGDGDDD